MNEPRESTRNGPSGRPLAAAILLLAQLLVLLLPHTDRLPRAQSHFDATPHPAAEHSPCVACTVAFAPVALAHAVLSDAPLVDEPAAMALVQQPRHITLHGTNRSRAPPAL